MAAALPGLETAVTIEKSMKFGNHGFIDTV
jgi:hypothetical protein